MRAVATPGLAAGCHSKDEPTISPLIQETTKTDNRKRKGILMPESPWSTVRFVAVLLALLNMDIVLSVLLGAGYAPTPAVAAAGTIGLFTAEIAARILPGGDADDVGLPPGATRLAL
jgi:hypothetical protein